MSLFTKLLKRSLSDFLHKRRQLLIILAVFIGLLIGLNFLINHYVDKVVGTLIKEFVHEKSNGFYKVEFEEIAYILNNGRFYVSNFKFDIHPDLQEKITYEDLTQNYLFGASIPVLHIDIIDFWSIFINRKLRVIGVEIKSPFIKIINLNKNKSPKKISFEAGNLYEILSGHLNELEIDDFIISDGEFDYETYQGPDYDNFNIKGLTFEVSNFNVNEKSISRKDKIFYTDNIFLEIKDQLLYLKDSIHKVTFDKFYISTKDNEFGFVNFNLTRREDLHINVKNRDHYEINLPELRLSGIDFLNAYNNNLLMIDSLQIQDPTINIKKRTTSQPKDTVHHNILDAALIYHDYLLIDHFNLSDANLIYTDETKDIPMQYSIDHISAHLTKVEIDTGNTSKYQYGFNFDKADLLIKDYEVKLPDSVNAVKFDEFSITSDPFEIKLKDLSVNPIASATSSSEKSQVYLSVPYMVIKDFDVARAINLDTVIIDEIYLENPEVKIIPAAKYSPSGDKQRSPGGLFGTYKQIQTVAEYLMINKINLVDAKFELENNLSENPINLSLNKINLALENLIVDSLTNTENDLWGELAVNLSLQNSAIDMPIAEISLQQLAYNSKYGRLQLNDLNFVSDSININPKIRANFPRLLFTGINPNEILFENKILLDSLEFNDVDIFVDLIEQVTKQTKENKTATSLPLIEVHHLVGVDYDVDIRENGSPLFFANDMNVNISRLEIDQSLGDILTNQFDYDEINLISVDNYDLYLRNQNHLFKSDKIMWDNKTSTFSMENVKLKPIAKTNNKYDIEVPGITMSGVDLKSILKKSHYIGDEIIIDSPKIHLKLAQGQQEKMTSLNLGFIPVLLRNRFYGAAFNTFNIKNTEINFHQQLENDSLIFEAENLNLLVDNFKIDSTTEMVPERFLFANDVKLQGDYVSAYHQINSDFYNINHLYVSTKEGDVRLNGVYYAINTKNEFPDKGKVKITVDNLNLLGLDFYALTQNRRLEIGEILIDNAGLQMTKKPKNTSVSKADSIEQELKKYNLSNEQVQRHITESELLENIAKTLGKELEQSKTLPLKRKNNMNLSQNEFLFDTLLLKSIEINKIVLTDSKIDLKSTDKEKSGLLIPDIWVVADGIRYDPILAKDSNRIFFSDNIMAKVTNFSYVLPDNLSAIKVDEFRVNSKDSTIKADNFSLVPLVSRYDYGLAKGYQSTWLQIENDSITLENVDFLGLINNQKFDAQSLNVHKLDISVFRDKRNQFPEWQRRPLIQTSLRKLDFDFGLDTININDGFIVYQEHAEKAYTTGEVFFSELDGKIINLTNDSVRMLSHPNAILGVTTKIFGEGIIKGEFVFDLVDLENIHSYGIVVEPFDLTNFNRILIPSASVQISSGNSKKIILSAKANEDYSYGEMKFYYEDLKIQLLNRETETPKGLGNALGSFFANTFIIKSNNPSNLFLRKGDIFFERDKKRAIFNYWTKTFLSGVVSSIGAVNNKKKIKKMQDENLKKIQEEKKELASN